MGTYTKKKLNQWRALSRSWRVFYLSIAISTFVIFALFGSGLNHIRHLPYWEGKPKFNGDDAYRWTEVLAKQFPNRVPWRPERKGAAKFIKNTFRKIGYKPQVITFDETIGKRHVTGLENIYGVLPGTKHKDEYIVVLGHYDVTDTTVEGAADDASGVGTVLELAKVFKNGPRPNRTMIFLATDSEEFGAFWGAHEFVRQFPHADKIVAAISLDFVAPLEQKDIMVLTDGLQRGYTPLWLRELALKSIREVPYPAADSQNFLEFVQRALLIPPTEHGAFLHAGIPAMNYFGRSTDFTYQMAQIHHTPQDKMENLRRESFTPYGKATEILMRSVDMQPPLLNKPDLRDGNYWKLTDNFYLSGINSILIHYVLFLTYLVYVALLLVRLRKYRRKQIVAVMKNEAKGFGLLFGALVVGYFVIRLLPEFSIISKYEMFPATQKSTILYNPNYIILGLVVTFIVVLSVVFSRFFRSRDDEKYNQESIEIRHTLLGIIMAIIIFLAFMKNSYLGTLLVIPPAYMWMYMKLNKTFDSKLWNVLLFLLGLTSIVAVAIIAGVVFHIGVIYWYLFLAMSYGLISIYAAILAFAIIAVAIRVLRNLIF